MCGCEMREEWIHTERERDEKMGLEEFLMHIEKGVYGCVLGAGCTF